MEEKTEPGLTIIDQTGTYLTHLSGNYLDWFNVGGLARHRTRETIAGLWTHYSWRELFIRGGVLTCTILSAAYGGQPENQNDNFSPGYSLVYGAAGFFISHSVAMLPTLIRRRAIVTQTNELVNEIIIKLDQLKEGHENLCELIFDKVNLIKQYNFPALKRGDAAANLMKKKCLMQEINSQLTAVVENGNSNFNALFKFWSQDVETLIDKLQQIINPGNSHRLAFSNTLRSYE